LTHSDFTFTTLDVPGRGIRSTLSRDSLCILVTRKLPVHSISEESSLSRFVVLPLELYLRENLLEQDLSTFDFSGLTSITVLDLFDNNCNGQLPASLWTLTTLVTLVLDLNAFEGELSADVSQLQNLGKLYTRERVHNVLIYSVSNRLLPLQFTTVRFTAGGNNLSGEIPASMSRMTTLDTIWLYNNDFSGTIFADIDRLANLVTFDVLGNGLTGELSTEFTGLLVLENLILGRNSFSGPIPDEYGNFRSLLILNLKDNELTGAVNPALGNLGDLPSLRIGGNQFDQADFPAFVYDMVSLTDLRLNNCQLSGNLDEAIGNLVDLRVLAIENNLLRGNIPDAITGLTSLTRFTANNNLLNGVIPANIGDLGALSELQLQTNELTGDLPAGMAGLLSLGTFMHVWNGLSLA
jgi:Leucine-rich repeat (LRR) protein